MCIYTIHFRKASTYFEKMGKLGRILRRDLVLSFGNIILPSEDTDVLCLDVDVPGLPIRQAVVEIFRGRGLRFLGHSQILHCDSSILFVVPGHRDFNRCRQECSCARIFEAA